MKMDHLRVVVFSQEERCRSFRQKLEAAGYTALVFTPGGDGDEIRRVREMRPHVIVVEDPLTPEIDALARRAAREELGPIFRLANGEEPQVKGYWGVLRPGLQPEDLHSILEPAVVAFRERERLSREVARLQQALENRKLVERAKGLLMDQYGLKDADAYRFMQEKAMANRQPLSEIARSIIALAELGQLRQEQKGKGGDKRRRAGSNQGDK